MAKSALAIAALYLLSIVASISPSLAQSPLLPFQHTAWTIQDGAPSEIAALAQTTDGYLWLGTANGLFRFDGVRFEAFPPPRAQHLLHPAIQSLTATSDGGLWIGYVEGGTSFLKIGFITDQEFARGSKCSGSTVYSIVVRRDGTVWAATSSGPIQFSSGVWLDVYEDPGLNIKTSDSLFEDSHGTLWMATEDFIYRRAYGAQHFEKTELLAGSNAIFAEGPDGTVWVVDQYGVHSVSDAWGLRKHPRNLIPYNDSSTDLRFDDSGALWVAGAKTGIVRIEKPNETLRLPVSAQKEAMEHFAVGNGLTSERALAVLKDHEGNLWVATAEGLDRFRMTALSPAPLPASFGFYGLAAEADGSVLIGTESSGLQRLTSGKLTKLETGSEHRITCIYRAPDGKLWLGGGNGDLGFMEHGHYTAVPVAPALKSPVRDTQAMTSGPDGDLWMQTASTLPILRRHDGRWNEVLNADFKTAAVVMTTDRLGRVWAGYRGGGITVFDGPKRTIFKRGPDFNLGNILAIYPSAESTWIGGVRGLDIVNSDHPVQIKFAGDIKVEGVSGVVRMEDGTLWLNALPGVLRIPSAEVDQAVKDPSHAMRFRLFNYVDGLSGKAPQIRPLPSVIRGLGKTLWFTTTNGAVSIDTAHIYSNPIIPPVSIEQVLVNGKSFDPKGQIKLPKGSSDLQIDYTALSLSIPERVLFRYMLEGYDKQWQDADVRRQAFYPHLPPGHYVFHVIACNNDGLWNETGAFVSLYLPPTFLQSWYFKALAAVLFLAAVWLLYLFRIKQETAKLRARLYERFSERERIARDLHDTFFQGIQGLLLSFQSASRRLPEEDPTRRLLEDVLVQSDTVMLQGRELVFNLRSRSREGDDLGTELETSAIEFARHYPSSFRLSVTGNPRGLNPHVLEEFCKLGREALCNSYRHAKATTIQVSIEYRSNSFRLTIADDGIGIDPEVLQQGGLRNHWGLPGMKERASSIGAVIKIDSSSDSGTSVRVEISSRLAYLSPKRNSLNNLRKSQG